MPGWNDRVRPAKLVEPGKLSIRRAEDSYSRIARAGVFFMPESRRILDFKGEML